jgi:L-ribulose-5-phosphate 4-epimerase
MCEDVARTALLARSLGELPRLPQEDIDALYDRYQNVYGQR